MQGYWKLNANTSASILGIHATTVSTHVHNLLCKLALESRLAAAIELVLHLIIYRRMPEVVR